MRLIFTLAFFVPAALAQPAPADPAAIHAGAALYARSCAGCHGADARGGEAPDLTRSPVVVSAPAKSLFATIRNGIPGTEMPALPLSDEQIRQVVSHLYSIARPGMGPPVAGDPEAGREVFQRAGCGNCHMIAGRGGFLGPDLSGVALRRFSSQIREKIRHPDVAVPAGFRPVRARTRQGQAVTGLLKNEDNFSLQILQPDGSYALLDRGAIENLQFEPATLMPAAALDDADLQNLLAYLDRQRAPSTSIDVRPSAY